MTSILLLWIASCFVVHPVSTLKGHHLQSQRGRKKQNNLERRRQRAGMHKARANALAAERGNFLESPPANPPACLLALKRTSRSLHGPQGKQALLLSDLGSECAVPSSEEEEVEVNTRTVGRVYNFHHGWPVYAVADSWPSAAPLLGKTQRKRPMFTTVSEKELNLSGLSLQWGSVFCIRFYQWCKWRCILYKSILG